MNVKRITPVDQMRIFVSEQFRVKPLKVTPPSPEAKFFYRDDAMKVTYGFTTRERLDIFLAKYVSAAPTIEKPKRNGGRKAKCVGDG